MGKFVWLIVAGGVLAGCSESPAPAPRAVTAAGVAQAPAVAPSCDVSRFAVKAIKGGFVDECRRTPCPQLKGAATIVNGCSVPAGVQVKITAIDASGNAVATRDIWPASTSNIPPGEYVFPLDYTLDYQPGMASLEVEPIAVRQW